MKNLYVILFYVLISASVFGQQLAFPSAEGGGMYTTGGRGGYVYFVTSLSDANSGNSSTGEGTLRWCLGRPGPRTIVFRVAGIIELTRRLDIPSNTTIAGQTAPGDGICLKNFSLHFADNSENIIVRYIRSRMGDEEATQDDAFWGRRSKDIIIDHCSLSWSTDECGSFYDNTNFTLQWCILSESLRISVHDKGSHGYGGIWGGKTASFHHNLLAHHDSRNPRMNGSRYSNEADLELVDFRNNVIYNWGGNSGYAGMGGSYNFINNYYKAGDDSSNKTRIFEPYGDDGKYEQAKGVWGKFYVNGNKVTASSVVSANNWEGIHPNTGNCPLPSGGKDALKADEPFDVPSVSTQSAAEAYELVLQYAGASLNRDETDARVMDEVKNGLTPDRASNGTTRGGLIDTQSDVGGWETYTYDSSEVPEDYDNDGMPDDWEDRKGLDPVDPSDRNNINAEGYTMLEVYNNSLVADNGPTAVKNIQADQAIRVFPNPVQQTLNWENVISAGSYKVFDLSGSLILEGECSGVLQQVSVENLQPGLYLLHLDSESQSHCVKFIKE